MDKEEMMNISSIVYDDIIDIEDTSRKRKFAGGNRDTVFEFNDSLQDDVIHNKQSRLKSSYQHKKKRK